MTLTALIAPTAYVNKRLQELISQERRNVTCLIVLVGDPDTLAPELAAIEALGEQIGLQANAIQVLICDEERRVALAELRPR